jgi:tRNA/rRNA methyltransferase
MTNSVKLDHVTIFLVRPQMPENIGFVARAMNNMGLKRLVLVDPKNYDPERALRTATERSAHIIEKIVLSNDFKDALGPFQYVVGTTARTGSHRPSMTQPRQLALDLIKISQGNQVAILFGPENRGLSNAHLRYCHTIATISTASFSSINLAQAVMIVCYEIFTASHASPESLPRLANTFELEGMYGHLNDVLTKIGFINPQNPEHWMLNIRRFLSRLPLRAREVKIIRGVCRQIDWYTDQLEKAKLKKRE